MFERITNEVMVLGRYRVTWRTVNDLAEDSAAIQDQPYFVQWVSELYGMTMALGVRKMADRSSDAASLFNLLRRIAEEPEQLTREWYVSDVYEDWVERFDKTFTERADPQRLDHIDPDVVLADQQRLVEAADPFRLYVNHHVAHAQAVPKSAIPKFRDLNVALDIIDELFVKYELLLTRAQRAPLEPVFQFPWQRIFDRAWSEKRDTSGTEGGTA
ncbi:hypothetical protein [Leifsonia sp. fls2-241-R2A-40a]|uniref:hypothetical protein n=1 Tax=Leifsonia sp. fls2-241-R2A-40a TaxID=3040290 RepID=UPI00254B21E9|nr:hypothetical protein [Leifsonia sp. fls2-241-R2A-40a]